MITAAAAAAAAGGGGGGSGGGGGGGSGDIVAGGAVSCQVNNTRSSQICQGLGQQGQLPAAASVAAMATAAILSPAWFQDACATTTGSTPVLLGFS